MRDDCYRRRYSIQGTLHPGLVDIRHLRLLITLCSISSPRMVMALEDVLVSGLSRREACERNGVSQSHVSVKLRRLQDVNQIVLRIYPYVLNELDNEGSL
ncbi:PapB/FocB family fimbrial expression transcriptional regulator [Citrobacter braakii]|uniref:PapB/FocB family fimbrial expression transcriptional regulator n=1 Tax=Citrobacter braakii TaxID=57706 RepID=UPI003976C69E